MVDIVPGTCALAPATMVRKSETLHIEAQHTGAGGFGDKDHIKAEDSGIYCIKKRRIQDKEKERE